MHDAASFEAAVEPLRRQLHVHCYQLVGGLAEADDLVQETLLRAWRKRAEMRDPRALRAWLFKIATNACFDELRRKRPRLSPWIDDAEHDREWVEPYPDVLIDGLADPAGAYSLRESVSLAFVAALQLLSARQRAALILRDVLDWRAAEVATFLGAREAAVESALARARTALAHTQTAPAPSELDEHASTLLSRYIAAWEAADVVAIAALLRDDARYSMPPLPIALRGRESIAAGLTSTAFSGGARFQMRATRAGGRIAVAGYTKTSSGWEAQALQVLDLDGRAITDIVAYLMPDLVPRTGLPTRLAAPPAPTPSAAF